MFTTIANTLRAVPFWTAMAVVPVVFMLLVPEYAPLCVFISALGVLGWAQKFRIYRSLRVRLKTQGGFRAESYEGYYRTWCERMALYQAAREAGFYESAYFHGRHVLGYRLYHIFPR